MKWIKTLTFLIIVAGIGSYIYFYEREMPTTEEREEKAKKVFDFESGDVNKLSLKKGERLIICERKEWKWQMVAPLNVRADKNEMDTMVSRLESLTAERRLEGGEGEDIRLGDFGLDNPGIEVAVQLGNRSVTFLLGDDSVVGNNMYAMLKDAGEILLVRGSLLNNIDKAVDDLRDKQVIEVDRFEATKFLIEEKEGSLECERDGDEWHIIKPLIARCDSGKIGEIFQKLNDLKVEEFVSEDPSDDEKFGFSSPELTVTIWDEDTLRSVMFGNREEGKIYARRKAFDSVYLVDKGIITDLAITPDELRDKKILTFSVSDVKRLVLDREGGKYLCERDAEDNWKLIEPDGAEIDTDTIGDIIWDISGLEVEGFAAEGTEDLGRYGLHEPQISLTVRIEKEEEEAFEETLLIGKKTGEGNFYARLESGEEIFELSGSVVENLRKDLVKKAEPAE